MQITVGELSQRLQGTVEGDPNHVITHPDKIERAGEGAICFLANPKYESYIYSTGATAILVAENFQPQQPILATLIRVQDPYSAFTQVLELMQPQVEQETGVSQFAFIHPSATIGEGVWIAPMAYVGKDVSVGDGARIHSHVTLGEGVTVGEGSTIHAGVRVYHRCEIGKRVIIHAGAVIGSDGFGFAPQPDGSYQKIPQTGNVVIADDVEIGANTTIDRATVGSTRIGTGAKIDNLVQIAHNVEIGAYTVIAAQAGISGSTRIGRYCQIGGQAGIVGHIEIADFSKINAQSGVSKAVTTAGSKLTGSPAGDYTATLRAQAVFRNLPQLEQRLRELEQIIDSIKKEQSA